MNELQNGVECAEHGVREATYVCQHLASAVSSGFHCGHADDDPDQLWPDAWCDACENVRASEGEWNDRSEAFAGIRLLCDGCYQRVRERNWKQDDAAVSRLVSDAVAYLQHRQDQLYSRYNLGGYQRYDWNQANGWEMTAIAAYLTGAAGAYRSPGDQGFSFLVMTDVAWAQ